jgi:hypothetical protein
MRLRKVAQALAQHVIRRNEYIAGTVEKNFRHSCDFRNTAQRKQLPYWRKVAQSGHPGRREKKQLGSRVTSTIVYRAEGRGVDSHSM